MTKADLRTGMIITCKNGNEYLIVLNCSSDLLPWDSKEDNGVVINLDDNGYFPLSTITNDLLDTGGNTDWTIIKVENLVSRYGFKNPTTAKRELLWERPIEKKKYTYEQIKEILGEEFEIVKE
jgi:hypothetical protein